jgi:hypothetical protein
VLLCGATAAADAPRDQYTAFDGDSVTIKDAFTKLEWDRRAVLTNVTYDAAFGGCALLDTLEGLGRLPSIKELLTVFDEQPHTEYEFGRFVSKQIDAVAFADTPVDLPYWSSTPGAPGKVWGLNFASGRMDQIATGGMGRAHARCVR